MKMMMLTYWMLGALAAEIEGADGLCNGYSQMGCASPADRNTLTLHTAGLANSWTCKRSSDGNFVQIDFILSDARVFVESVWNDFVVPIGLDHRCVHSIMSFKKRAATHKRWNDMGWKIGNPLWMIRDALLISSMQSPQLCRPGRCRVSMIWKPFCWQQAGWGVHVWNKSNVSENQPFCNRFVLTVGWHRAWRKGNGWRSWSRPSTNKNCKLGKHRK